MGSPVHRQTHPGVKPTPGSEKDRLDRSPVSGSLPDAPAGPPFGHDNRSDRSPLPGSRDAPPDPPGSETDTRSEKPVGSLPGFRIAPRCTCRTPLRHDNRSDPSPMPGSRPTRPAVAGAASDCDGRRWGHGTAGHVSARPRPLRRSHAATQVRCQRPHAAGRVAGLLAQLRRRDPTVTPAGDHACGLRRRDHALRSGEQLRTALRQRGTQRRSHPARGLPWPAR